MPVAKHGNRALSSRAGGADVLAVLGVEIAAGDAASVLARFGLTFLFAANQNSDNIVLFRVNAATGRLTPSGQIVEQVPEPACVVFVPKP